MSDEPEVNIENYEEVVGDFYHNSPQPTVRTPTVDGSQQPTPNQNSYDGSARSTPRLVHGSSAGNIETRGRSRSQNVLKESIWDWWNKI